MRFYSSAAMFDVVKTVWATGSWTAVRKQLSILLSCYSVSLNVYSVYLYYLRPANRWQYCVRGSRKKHCSLRIAR